MLRQAFARRLGVLTKRASGRDPTATTYLLEATQATAAELTQEEGLGMQSAAVQRAAASLRDEIQIARRSVSALKQFQHLSGQRDLKVHLGCGPELKPGWVNVDLDLNNTVPSITPNSEARTVFINYDLRSGVLPLEDGSCRYIYSSHFLEHLEYQDGMRLMRDCYRVLRDAGIFRAALPTFKAMLGAYVRGDAGYFAPFDILEKLPFIEAGTETLVDHVNYGVYQFGEHKCIYDEEKMCRLLRQMGFSTVTVSSYDETIDPTNELRRRYSFYIEAAK